MDKYKLIGVLLNALHVDDSGAIVGFEEAADAILSRLENLRQSAEYALMYLETGFVECHNCGSEVETKNLDAAYELRSALAGKDATGRDGEG